MRRLIPAPILPVGSLLLAVALQAGFAHRFHILGAQPDFVLVVALLFAVYSGPATGAGMGFAAGLSNAVLVGETVGTWIVARTVAGYLAGSLSTRWLQPGREAVVAAVAMGTLVEGIAILVANPGLGIGRVAGATLIACCINSIAGLPFALLLHNRLSHGRNR